MICLEAPPRLNAAASSAMLPAPKILGESRVHQGTAPPSLRPPQEVPRLFDMGSDASGAWEAIWSSYSPGWEYSLAMRLEIQDGAVEGTNLWRLLQYPEGGRDYGRGKTATEFLLGTYDAARRSLELRGTSKDDPDDIIIALDSYTLTLSEDGGSLCGTTASYVRSPS